ncbi:hypothetical protein F5B19DRAFT_491402 [Rostrohypoxylon terebratum]|nr:hypothetical protein F5B19DRAFT_491402 [Rostrohypoxylon terebratum]
MPEGENKGNTPHPHAASTGIHESTFPTGIFLSEQDGRDSGVSRQSTIVGSSNAAGEGNDASNEASDASATRGSIGDSQQPGSGDDIENVEIQIARPVSILRVGSARLINSRSSGTIRTVTFDLPDTPQSGVQHSTTKPNTQKSPSQSSVDDPVANYIKKNAQIIQEAKRKWHQSANDNLRQAQSRAQRNQGDGDLYMVPCLDKGEFGAQNLGVRGMEALAHSRGPSEKYAQQIRDMSDQGDCSTPTNVVRRMSSTRQLRGDGNVNPATAGPRYSDMVGPMATSGRFPRGPYDMPISGPQRPGMTHQSDVNARRGLARLQELRPSRRLPAVQEADRNVPDVEDVPDLVGGHSDSEQEDADEEAPEAEKYAGSRIRRQIMAIIEEDEDDEEEDETKQGEEKKKEKEKKPEKKLSEMNDYELKEKATRVVEDKFKEFHPKIFGQVRKYVEDKQHAEIITQTIMGMDNDIVEACADKDTADGQDLVKAQVMQIRRESNIDLKFGAMSYADMQYHTNAVKAKKVDELVKKWKEEVQAEIEAPLKGKGKAAAAAPTQRPATRSDSEESADGFA